MGLIDSETMHNISSLRELAACLESSEELHRSADVSECSDELGLSQCHYRRLYRLYGYEIISNLRVGTDMQVQQSLRRLFAEMRRLDLNRGMVQVICCGLLLHTYETLDELGHDPDEVYGQDFPPLGKIVAARSLDELEEFFVGLLGQACASIAEDRGCFNRKRIETICKYVQENFVSDVSLAAIAKQHRISPSYLSLLFVKETGKKFSDYLTDCRINRAKEILKHTDKRICEVAMEVGYRDPYYFSNRFKKVTGVCPSEYREHVAQ